MSNRGKGNPLLGDLGQLAAVPDRSAQNLFTALREADEIDEDRLTELEESFLTE